jgi:hypothetical protein
MSEERQDQARVVREMVQQTEREANIGAMLMALDVAAARETALGAVHRRVACEAIRHPGDEARQAAAREASSAWARARDEAMIARVRLDVFRAMVADVARTNAGGGS